MPRTKRLETRGRHALPPSLVKIRLTVRLPAHVIQGFRARAHAHGRNANGKRNSSVAIEIERAFTATQPQPLPLP